MPRSGAKTRDTIIVAANTLFYRFGIKATSLDAIAERAGVTKRTVYYHFRSKDDLIAEYLATRDQPNLEAFQAWFEQARGTLPERVRAIFDGVAETIGHARWRGCGFQRTVGELANKPGHPAFKVASAHKKRVESWLAYEFQQRGVPHPEDIACQVTLLLEGAFAAMLMHRDRRYVTQAGNAAACIVGHSLSGRSR
ncbi:MAG: TetR/AcrR family transcriptional regulator [Gammaproteobacteria bacterium]|nr:TetR/AcrR family transcriptional regulator [Gammaproteobacteria bacterium]